VRGRLQGWRATDRRHAKQRATPMEILAILIELTSANRILDGSLSFILVCDGRVRVYDDQTACLPSPLSGLPLLP
jgi:hypothetical protein